MMNDTKYEAAFVVLFERSRELLPEVETMWGTEKLEAWVKLMRDLMRAEGTLETGTSSVKRGA